MKKIKYIKYTLKIISVCCLIILIPWIVLIIFRFCLIQSNPIEIDGFLAYYGAVAAIVPPAFFYFSQKEHEKEEIEQQSAPVLSIDTECIKESIYLNIDNVGDEVIRDIYLYDQRICSILFPMSNIESHQVTIRIHRGETGYLYSLMPNGQEYPLLVAGDSTDAPFPNSLTVMVTDKQGSIWEFEYVLMYENSIYYQHTNTFKV